MILRSLFDLAARERLVTDPDFPLAPVAWLVTVSTEGQILSIVDTREPAESDGKRKPRPIPRSFPVPRQPGRSGIKAPASFLVDNAKYVFGKATPDKLFAEAEGREKSGWFRDALAACVRVTGDEGASAVLRALEDISTGHQAITLPPTTASNELFAFVYEPDVDLLVHQRPAVQAYWREQRTQEIVSDAVESFTCVVTGETVAAPENFPKVKYVPGGQTSGTPLVSFNARAFESYGLEGNENAPISRAAAEACATALQRLLHPAFPHPARQGAPMQRRNIRLSEDTAICYWSNSSRADPLLDSFGGIFEGDPGSVGETYRSVWRGRPAPLDDPGSFYALTVSGAQGRMVVRDWFESSLIDTSRHLARHFADLAIVRNARPAKGRELSEAIPLRAMLAALAPLGREKEIPPALAGQFVQAALRGTPYPFSILQRAIERARAEVGRTEWADLERRDARAALIKAVLRRRRFQSDPTYAEISVALDPSSTSPGYLCGRLMAVIERLQQAALGDVNASVVDRYFGSASATPRAVFTRLLRSARHHARKAKDDPTTAGTARWLEGQIDAISAPFDVKTNGFPAFLDLEQQGLFVLGYHQQRHALWAKRSPVTEPIGAPAA